MSSQSSRLLAIALALGTFSIVPIVIFAGRWSEPVTLADGLLRILLLLAPFLCYLLGVLQARHIAKSSGVERSEWDRIRFYCLLGPVGAAVAVFLLTRGRTPSEPVAPRPSMT